MDNIQKYIVANFEKVKINSRDILQGDVFIALKGNNTHGNLFIAEALKKKVKFVVTDSLVNLNINNKKIIIVKDTLLFLLEIAVMKRKLYNGKVLGITGSIGKTSLKENLKYFLSKKFIVSSSIKSFNNYLGVIISLLNLNLKSDFAIFEIGTSNFSEIRKLTSIILPSQVIITNIYPTHLENLLNTRNIAKEKSDIFKKKYNSKILFAILPNDNEDEKYIVKKAAKDIDLNIYTFGKNSNSDINFYNITKLDDEKSKVSLKFKTEKIQINIHNHQIKKINNILACLLIFDINRLDKNLIISNSLKIPLLQGRGLEKKIKFNNKYIYLIDESYNASPQSMINCIDYLCDLKTSSIQKKYLILGEMKELGKKQLIFHQDILKLLIKKKMENVIICGELFKLSLDVNKKNKFLFMSDINSILKHLNKFINGGDILLIKGSNSSMTNNLSKFLLTKGNIIV